MDQTHSKINRKPSKSRFEHFEHSIAEIMSEGNIIWISEDLLTIAKAMKRNYRTGKRTVYLMGLDEPVDAATRLKYEKYRYWMQSRSS